MRIWRRGRNHHVLPTTEPQDRGGNEHEHTRNTKSERRPEISEKDRHKERGEERAKVDDPVESIEHHLGAMLVRLVELVADKRSHTWFDSARAKRDQAESDIETDAVGDKHREASLTPAVDQAEPEDDVVFAEEAVSQPTAQERKEVNADDKSVKNVLRAPGALCLREIEQQRGDEEDGENIAHPVKTESLASFIADDVADLFGNGACGSGIVAEVAGRTSASASFIQKTV